MLVKVGLSFNKPSQNDENNYRQYGFNDIDVVLTIEFYRFLDLEFIMKPEIKMEIYPNKDKSPFLICL